MQPSSVSPTILIQELQYFETTAHILFFGFLQLEAPSCSQLPLRSKLQSTEAFQSPALSRGPSSETGIASLVLHSCKSLQQVSASLGHAALNIGGLLNERRRDRRGKKNVEGLHQTNIGCFPNEHSNGFKLHKVTTAKTYRAPDKQCDNGRPCLCSE